MRLMLNSFSDRKIDIEENLTEDHRDHSRIAPCAFCNVLDHPFWRGWAMFQNSKPAFQDGHERERRQVWEQSLSSEEAIWVRPPFLLICESSDGVQSIPKRGLIQALDEFALAGNGKARIDAGDSDDQTVH